MLDVKKLLVKIGPQHLAKGIERGLVELDKVLVSPVQPSIIGNLAFTLAGVAGGFMAPAPWDEILAIWGGHHSTTLWDYLEGMTTPAVRARAAVARTYVPSTGSYVPTRPGLTRQVKYAPEQSVVTAPKFIPGQLRPKFQLGN